MAPRMIPLKYSCEEIYDRMSNGLCIFCEDLDTPGHHDLKHKGVEIIMIESDDQPIVTGSDDNPLSKENLVKYDEFVTETVMQPDTFSESLEVLTSGLQIVDAAGEKEAQNKSDAEENMSFSFGNKVEHLVGKQSQEADRVWEPGGFIAKPDQQMIQTDAILHGQMYVFPEKISQACQSQKAHLVWEPGGSVGKQAPGNCLDKYLEHDVVLKLNAKTHETSTSAEETQTWMVNVKMSFKVLPDLNFKYQKLMSLLVKEPRRVWERGRLTDMCALAIVMRPFDISFDDMGIQDMRKSCVLKFVGSATMIMMRWLHMIELVCSIMIKLDEKSSLKNLEKFRSLEKTALLNVLEPVMPSSRRQLVAGLRHCTFAGIKFYLKHKWRSLMHLWIQDAHKPPVLIKGYRDRNVIKSFCSLRNANMCVLQEIQIRELYELNGGIETWQERVFYEYKFHAFLLSFLVISNTMELWEKKSFHTLEQVIVAVNKMDSVGYWKNIYDLFTVENDEVLLKKLCSIESYYKACLLLELTYMEFIGDKIHNKELLVAGLTKEVELEAASKRGVLSQMPLVDFYRKSEHDYMVLMLLEQVYKANTLKELAAIDVRVRLLWETITDVTVALYSGCALPKDFTEHINWSKQGMQDHAGFNLFGTEMFQVKHKWRYKPFPIVSELELKDEVTLDTRNEDALSCYTTGQAREEVVSSYVEVRRTIEMSQSKTWIFKYNNERQERDMSETQQQDLKIKCGQSKYFREVQKLELTSMAGNYVYNNRRFTGFCVNEVFHLQRPPEMLAEKDHQRCYDGFSTKFLSSLRTRMFSTREYCNRINRLSFWVNSLIFGLALWFSYLV